MANPEHVERVKKGTKAVEFLILTEKLIDLEGANLEGVDLSGVEFMLVNLRSAVLTRAKLMRTDLAFADLSGANFQEADLFHGSLAGANLDGADFRRADLKFANLTGASAVGADFDRSEFYETIIGDVDFSGARGLESVIHSAPSVIDERALRKSWPLPEVFLRGVGLSDQYIEYLPSLMSQAIEYYSCFISYSTKDDEFAKRLHTDLQAEGVRCWFAPEDMRIGDKVRARIDEAIRLHDKLLLILSEDSVNSTWVEDEVESALEKERKAKERGEERTVLFPIRLDEAVMETDAAWAASIRRTRHIGDFSAWKGHDTYQKAFERLLRDLKAGAKPTS